MTEHKRWTTRTVSGAVTLATMVMMAVTLLGAGCGSAGGGTVAQTTSTGLSAQAAVLYPVAISGGTMGYIDKSGAMVIPATFAEAAPFSEGLAAVRTEAYGLWGYVDKTGAMVIPATFADASPFSEGLAAVRLSADGSWGYANTTGEMVIQPQFAAAHDFSEGLARVRAGEETGYVDPTGKWIIRMTDHEAVGEFSGGLALVFDSVTGLYGYINSEGEVAIAPAYADAWGFSEGCAAVRLPTTPLLYGYINKQGDWIVQPAFADARPFSEGLAAAQAEVDGLWGYVDVTGASAIDSKWDLAEPFHQGIARVARRVGDTGAGYLLYGYAYIDLTGKVIWRDQALTQFDSGVTTTTTPDPPR